MLAKSKGIVYNEHRKSTHSKADAPKRDYLPLNERHLSCGLGFFLNYGYFISANISDFAIN